MTLRRVRGVLIRVVRRRPLALSIGTALAAPAAWMEFSGRYHQWWVDGLSLILAATGVAMLWSA